LHVEIRQVQINRDIRKKDLKMNDQTRAELEAAAFRGLVAHLQKRTDAQNIDIMNLAGFCRNCLSKWYLAAAKERNIKLDFDAAREVVYGMPYAEWKEKYQHEASKEQQEIYEKTKPLHAKIT
jgi:hypothetical protein